MSDSDSSSARVVRLVSMAKSEWQALAAGTLFLLIGSGMMLLYPQAIRVILDKALSGGNTEDIDRAALAMVAIFTLQGIAGSLRYYLFTTAGERIVTRLRSDLYARIMRQEIGFFDERPTGELMSRLAADAGVLQNAVSVNVSMGLRHGAMAIGGIGLLFYISPILTALMLAVVPPVALGAVVYGRRVRKLSKKAQDALADAAMVAEETIGAHPHRAGLHPGGRRGGAVIGAGRSTPPSKSPRRGSRTSPISPAAPRSRATARSRWCCGTAGASSSAVR